MKDSIGQSISVLLFCPSQILIDCIGTCLGFSRSIQQVPKREADGRVTANKLTSSVSADTIVPIKDSPETHNDASLREAVDVIAQKITDLETLLLKGHVMGKSLNTDVMTAARAEWILLSLILDRLFFILFLLGVLVNTGVYFPRPE